MFHRITLIVMWLVVKPIWDYGLTDINPFMNIAGEINLVK